MVGVRSRWYRRRALRMRTPRPWPSRSQPHARDRTWPGHRTTPDRPWRSLLAFGLPDVVRGSWWSRCQLNSSANGGPGGIPPLRHDPKELRHGHSGRFIRPGTVEIVRQVMRMLVVEQRCTLLSQFHRFCHPPFHGALPAVVDGVIVRGCRALANRSEAGAPMGGLLKPAYGGLVAKPVTLVVEALGRRCA